LLVAITADPDKQAGWLQLASWLRAHDRFDEAAAVRVLWPSLRDNLGYASLGDTLAFVARNAPVLAAIARKVEPQADDVPPTGPLSSIARPVPVAMPGPPVAAGRPNPPD
jgi:hypothetical protein